MIIAISHPPNPLQRGNWGNAITTKSSFQGGGGM